MNKLQFVEKHRHEFGGMIADASTHTLKGAELAIRIRQWFTSIDQRLGTIYDELTPAAPAAKGPNK